jgi:hypothetical protein
MKTKKSILRSQITTTQNQLCEIISMFGTMENTLHNFMHVRDLQNYFDIKEIRQAREELERLYDERTNY